MDKLDCSKPYDVLVLGGHPDDPEMAIGGTIAGLSAAGKRVAMVSLTRGELGTHGDAETRAREAAHAAEILSVDIRHLDLPDGGVEDTMENRHRIARLIRETRPRIVFAPYPWARTGPLDGRSNLDHLACGELALAGAKLARFKKLELGHEAHNIERIWYYMLPDNLHPSVTVDVSEHRDTLVRAVEAYESQMVIGRGERGIMDMLLLWRRNEGQRIHVELGESFYCEDRLTTTATGLLEL